MPDTTRRDRLIEDHQRLACHIARRFHRHRVCPSLGDLDDYCQTALLALIEAADRYDPAKDTEGKPAAYLARCVVGQLLQAADESLLIRVPRDLLRAVRADPAHPQRGDVERAAAVVTGPLAGDLADRHPGPERAAIRHEETDLLHLAVADLPPAQREAVECILDGLTPTEAAKRCGITRAAFDHRSARAQAALRRRLSPQKEDQ